ncbi:hypothetical protein PFISCL1PPCAC_5811, partial [Pristionchus fissidentatus]
IHANWVDVPDKRRYICTQGPITATIDDFWRMIWQEKCKSIVMLCNIVECGKKKCEQYWPETGEASYGALQVKVTAKAEFEKLITVTNLTVTDGSDSLELEHIIWNNWPDKGVPADTHVLQTTRQAQEALSYRNPLLSRNRSNWNNRWSRSHFNETQTRRVEDWQGNRDRPSL